jgi:hypothetical protein
MSGRAASHLLSRAKHPPKGKRLAASGAYAGLPQVHWRLRRGNAYAELFMYNFNTSIWKSFFTFVSFCGSC